MRDGLVIKIGDLLVGSEVGSADNVGANGCGFEMGGIVGFIVGFRLGALVGRRLCLHLKQNSIWWTTSPLPLLKPKLYCWFLAISYSLPPLFPWMMTETSTEENR